MRRAVLSIALLIALASAGGAAAATGTQVIADCNAHGKLTSTYTVAALRNALATMPADVKEYTNCSDVVERALLDRLASRHVVGASSVKSGGSFLPTWLIVVLVVLVLGAVTAAAVSARRRRHGA